MQLEENIKLMLLVGAIIYNLKVNQIILNLNLYWFSFRGLKDIIPS